MDQLVVTPSYAVRSRGTKMVSGKKFMRSARVAPKPAQYHNDKARRTLQYCWEWNRTGPCTLRNLTNPRSSAS